jgi:membrane protease YdiL (CAAX protease family)
MDPRPITLNTLLISTIAVIAIESAARIAIAMGTWPPMVDLGLARIFQIIVMVFFVRRWGKGLISIGISRLGLVTGLKKGVIWSLCFGITIALIFSLLWLLGVNVLKFFQTSKPLGYAGVLLIFVVGALIGPIAEEIFFRGILYGFFRQWGFAPALVTSTILFVLPHFAGNNIPLTQLVGGFLFAIAYEVEENLIVPIIIHCLGNLSIFSLSFIAQI